MIFKTLLVSLASISLFFQLSFITGAEAASFPTKPIRLIVPYAAGSGTDIQARGMVPYMEKYLKVRVIIENIPGAGCKIGLTKAWKADPDGYTLIYHVIPGSITNQYMYNAEFEIKDYTHIHAVTTESPVLCVNIDSWKTWAEFTKAALSRTLSGGVSSISGAVHMMGLSMAEKLGAKVNWVPYSGGSAALAAVAGKHLDFTSTFSGTALPLIKAGKLRALIFFADERDIAFPNVPTSKELGFDIALMPSVLGISGPPKMAPERTKIIVDAMVKVVNDPEFIDWTNKRSIKVLRRPTPYWHQFILEQYAVVEKFRYLFQKVTH